MWLVEPPSENPGYGLDSIIVLLPCLSFLKNDDLDQNLVASSYCSLRHNFMVISFTYLREVYPLPIYGKYHLTNPLLNAVPVHKKSKRKWVCLNERVMNCKEHHEKGMKTS